jgi:hypothetical protein
MLRAPPGFGDHLVLAVDLRAELTVLDAPSYLRLAYRPGVPLVSRVWLGGEEIPLLRPAQ